MKYLDIQTLLKILSYVGVFLGGVAVAYGQGWVTDHFKKKEEKRKLVEEFMGKITDVVAEATAGGYKDFPTGGNKSRLTKAAAQLERLGQSNMARTVRKYMNKWIEYNDLVFTSFGEHKKYFDEAKAIELRNELDDLTDILLK